MGYSCDVGTGRLDLPALALRSAVAVKEIIFISVRSQLRRILEAPNSKVLCSSFAVLMQQWQEQLVGGCARVEMSVASISMTTTIATVVEGI